ncbi:hypothetical protein Tco_0854449 [Tanacetum coccineum]
MKSNKSIHRSDEQKNLYKALVDAYESDKLILDTYGDTVSFKRRRDDEDKDEESYAGSNWGSKRRRAGKEPESTSALKEKNSKTIGKSTEGSKSHHKSAQAEEPMHTAKDLEEPAHQEFDTRFSEDQPVDETTQHHDCSLAMKEDTRDSFNELMDTPLDFLAFMMNQLKVDTLNPELLAGPTFELMKGSSKSLVELEYFLEEVYKATTDQLDWNNPEGQQYLESLTGVESIRNSIDLVSIGNLLLMSTPDTESLLLQSFRLSNGIITSIWIGSLFEEMITSWIHSKKNKDKKNKLMRIDELHKFSDGTLNHVQTALVDILKRIRMKYLPHTYWKKVDKDRAGAMI